MSKRKRDFGKPALDFDRKDVDPFSGIDINDGDIFEATPDFLTLDSDREDDEDIDIKD